MYEFVDVSGSSSVKNMPSEALKLNGEYIENLISGYRTLHVKGRELLSCEIDDYQIGNTDGSQYRGKRYPARVITVTYQLIAESDTAFREAFNKLNSLLDAEEATLVFYDEPDKYFIGTKASNSEITPGRNSIVGEIEFYCSDPFKHSVAEKTFQASKNDNGVLEMTIINNGTVPVPISYTITHNHENGYIGIVSENGVMEYGDVAEADDEEGKRTELLIDYGSTPEGTDFSEMTDGAGSHQTVSNIAINGTWKTVTENTGPYDGEMATKFLTLASAGKESSSWNGAVRSVKIPADSHGDVGATYWRIDLSVWFEIIFIDDVGAMELCVSDSDGNYIVSIDIYKTGTTTQTSRCTMWLADGQSKKVDFTATDRKTPFVPGKIIQIQKSGKNFSMSFGGKTYTLSSSALQNKVASSISILMYTWKTCGVSRLPGHMYFYSMKFYKNNVTYYYDVPNRYREGDVLRIDGNTTKPYLNSKPCLEDEVIGTEYFKAPPGKTTVQFYYSDFCEAAPTIEAHIREAYI